MSVEVSSPGKLILSGEHAVVQGCPALALAVNRRVLCRTTPLPEKVLRIRIGSRDPRSYPLARLPSWTDTSGAPPEPEALLAACSALLRPETGIDVRVEAGVPPGAGLGASAATILSLLKSIRPGLSDAELEKLAVRGEHLQHGTSSGLDVAVSLRGGLLGFQDGQAHPLSLPKGVPAFQVYHSGKSLSSTGECVTHSCRVFQNRPELNREFTAVTGSMRTALVENSHSEFEESVRKNHRLLCELGVVPAPVQKDVSTLEQSGFSAKVCGAGSVRGARAGMILVCGPGPHPVPESWQPMHLKPETRGTCIHS